MVTATVIDPMFCCNTRYYIVLDVGGQRRRCANLLRTVREATHRVKITGAKSLSDTTV